MKLSVITPSFNQGKFIRDTIESVMNQNFPDFEHIIIDGGSSDNTLDILKEYSHLIWKSEKDAGPVDAITKGFKMARGEIITWLNSDDYFEKDIFKEIVKLFEDKETRIVIGNMILIDPDKNFLYENNDNTIYSLHYLVKINSDVIKQPSTFFRKDLFYAVGGFDKSLRLVWDYDLFVKMLKVSKPKMVDKTFAYQRIYETTLSRSFSRRQAIEIFCVAKKHGARLTDDINKLVIKRFIFPSTVSGNPNIIFKIIRFFKKKIKNLYR